jgi:hypothetical protein
MEAATPLRPPVVRRVGDRLVVDALVIDDACVVRLVEERERAGDDPVKVVVDAVEIGARVLDRERAEVHAEFVRAEFERVTREVERSFSDRAREAAEAMGRRVDEVFDPGAGHLTRALERHFSDESSVAVQNRVKVLVADVMARQREDLLRLFSSAEGHNPLAEFKASAVAALRQAGDRQEDTLRALADRMTALQLEVQGLRAEREKRDAVAEERERGTAKGRSFEERIALALDEIAAGQGDVCEAVGDRRGATGRAGDVVVDLDACRGASRGRIAFEAKTGRLSRPEAMRELDRGKAQRDADFAVLVVPADDKVPARVRPLREYDGDKLVVACDLDGEGRLALELAYSLARARVLMSRSEGERLDHAAVRERVERALGAMEDVRRIKSQLTGARRQIDTADGVLDAMAEREREHLRDIGRVVSEATGAPGA